MRVAQIEMTPELLEKLKGTTARVLEKLHESGLSDDEIFLALSMTLRHYEEKTGLRLNSVVGLKMDT